MNEILSECTICQVLPDANTMTIQMNCCRALLCLCIARNSSTTGHNKLSLYMWSGVFCKITL